MGMWVNATREKIQNDLGTKDFKAVSQKASELWKGLPEVAKKPWEQKAKDQKDAFEKFKNTDEGKKALEDQKAERKADKDEKKRKADEKEELKVQKEEKRAERA